MVKLPGVLVRKVWSVRGNFSFYNLFTLDVFLLFVCYSSR